MTSPQETLTEEATPEILDATVLGRTIKVRTANAMQIGLLGRAMDRSRRLLDSIGDGRDLTEDEGWAVVRAMASVLDILEALIVNSADRDWLTDQMTMGNIPTLEPLRPLLNAVAPEAEPVKPNRAARRRK